MLRVYIFTVILILGKGIRGEETLGVGLPKADASENNEGKTVASFIFDDRNVDKIFEKFKGLEESNENLKLKLQVLEKSFEVQTEKINNLQLLQQSRFDTVLTKLEALMNQGNAAGKLMNHECASPTAVENVEQKLHSEFERVFTELKVMVNATELKEENHSNFEKATQQTLQNLSRNVDDLKVNSATRKDLEDIQQHFQLPFAQLSTDLKRVDSQLKEVKSEIKQQVDRISEKRIYSGCAEALSTTRKSGVYAVKVDSHEPTPFDVYCDAQSHGGNWTVIQRRKDGSVDFYRNWAAYKRGFGDLSGEFFIGLDKLHALTFQCPQELLIEMENFEGTVKYARYADFAVGSENEDFALNVLGEYSGDVIDSLSLSLFKKFSTFDRDNDKLEDSNCAVDEHGAWWYASCGNSNLNGRYNKNKTEHSCDNVYWFYFFGCLPLKRVQMSIRPKSL